MVITTAQLYSTKPELRFRAGSNPARGVSEIHDDEDLSQWSCLEVRLNAFRWSTIPQKQFIIIIIIIIHDNYTRVEMPFNSLMTEFFEGSDINELIKRMLAHIKTQVENPRMPESRFTLIK